MPSRRLVSSLVVVVAVVAVVATGCGKSGPPGIRRKLSTQSGVLTGLPGEHVGSLAEAKPSLTIDGVSGAVEQGARTVLSTSALAKRGAVAITIAGVPAAPGRDGDLELTITGTAVFAHPPQISKLTATITGTLSYNGIDARTLGAELGGVVVDWLTGAKLPADVGLPEGPVAAPKQVAVGSPSCSLHEDGTVRCWDKSGQGVPINAVAGTTAIAAAVNFGACGIRADGHAYCIDAWGNAVALEARAVCGVEGATAISVGQQTACAIVGDGHVRCWGRTEKAFEPCSAEGEAVEVKGVTGAVALDTGPFAGCAITGGGGVACWELCGEGCKSGVVGRVDTPPVAHAIKGLTKATQLVTGHEVCAATGDRVACRSTDGNGKPTAAVVPEPVTQLARGAVDTCARGTSGHVFCWTVGTKPEAVADLADVVDFDADISGSCAVTARGVVCWGGMGEPTPPQLIDLSY